jgi:hypothetical protein
MVGGLFKEINIAHWLVVEVLELIGMFSSNNATNKVQTSVDHKCIYYLTS